VGALFNLVDSVDSLFIQGVSPETINGISGKGDDATLFEYRDSAADLFFYSELFRHLGQVTSALRT
jgi:hypothetical protein